MRTWSSISVLQHEGCLHNVPVYRLVLTARRIMARRTSFSCVEWRNEAFVLNTWQPQFHLKPQESANIPKTRWALMGLWPNSLELSKLFRTLFCLWDTNLLLFVVVKVARVSWSSALWQEGSFDLRMQKKIRNCFLIIHLNMPNKSWCLYVNYLLLKYHELCLFLCSCAHFTITSWSFC